MRIASTLAPVLVIACSERTPNRALPEPEPAPVTSGEPSFRGGGKSDASIDAGRPAGPSAGTGGGTPTPPSVPIDTVEPLVQCERGEFYCNGACLSEVGVQVGTCRIVYSEPSPIAVLSDIVVNDETILVAHDWGVGVVQLADLSTQRLVEGFDSVRYILVENDTLYIAGARGGVPSVWTLPTSGGEPTSLGLDGNEVEWLHLYRGVLYHSVRISRPTSVLRSFDLATGVVTDVRTPSDRIVPVSDVGFFPYSNIVWRAPLDNLQESAVEVAEVDGHIWAAYSGEDALYFVVDGTPQNVLWRLGVSASEPEFVVGLPPAYGATPYDPFNGDLLIKTCPTFDSTETFWTVPLDGDDFTKVTELDACDSATTRGSLDSAMTTRHVYHAQETSRTETASASVIIEVERP